MKFLLFICLGVLGWFCVDSLADEVCNVESIDCSQSAQLTLKLPAIVDCDHEITAESASSPPFVIFGNAKKDQHYLIVMVDPDAPYPDTPTLRYYLHWMVAGVRGDAILIGNLGMDAVQLMEYMAPSPPGGSDAHRYQFLLFEQPDDEWLPVGVPEHLKRAKFDLQLFAEENDLCGRLVAATQYKATA